MSFDPDAISSNPSDNPEFSDILAARVSRRGVLAGGLGTAAIGFLGGAVGRAGEVAAAAAPAARPVITFTPVPTGSADAFVVPDGYVADVIIPWGTPIHPGGPAWKKDGTNTAAEQLLQVGAHHDGMHFFPLDDGGKGRRRNQRGLLVLNHEYIDQTIHYSDGPTPMTQEKVNKALAGHGVTVIEVELVDGKWRHVDSSPYNRRVTPLETPVTYSGPVGPDHPLLQSMGDPFGTINNCSFGHTPWGTYLACEENWNGYYGSTTPFTPTAVEARYGLDAVGFGYGWFAVDDHWNLAVNRNGPYRWGWVVEIDPFDPDAMPVKRTALGRIKHEGALVTESRGRIVVYTGDDQDKDYVYKFVGNAPWRRLRDEGKSPLDEGTLYVARFNDDGSGDWVPLVHGRGNITTGNGFANQADVILRTRMAADVVGATKMDRPEWIAENPRNGEIFVTLTNGTSGSNAPNQRFPNPYGHIIKWRERGGDKTGTRFEWDVFILAGDPQYDPAVQLPVEDIFGSPDGLHFDRDGRLWIETDISNSSQNRPDRGYDRIGNNAMLACDPHTGEIRRFCVGPRGCELTGAVTTPDLETIFVNVQHPGEATTFWGTPTAANPRAVSNWPDFDPAGRPRSATVAIRKIGGGKVGT
jgi:secreted PhoX family phosphatase